MRKTLTLAVAAVALTGCGMLPGQLGGGGGEEKQQTAVQAQPTEAQPTQRPTTSDEPQQSAAPQSDQVIATRETKVASGAAGAGGTARADITVLKRQGKTVTLNWTLTVVDGEVNMHNGMGSAVLDYSVSGVSLIDPVNAKRYRVARNGTGSDAECVCSDTQGEFLKKGQTVTLYALFAAPPADVTKLNIEMPMIGVLTDVPIS
ncbi:hypothetical protein LDL08_06820 [Nonomuraea glycinis]|uniref:DUF4352 domain-containing protein n=1 Tax=Nonomuraea glycinis TaxID=2047744 RepID=A0A918A368_9ACTN|nr:hypothetical protein [Nonomuraea glycinis]MCA2175892.1 hypothetical protein [Nonomuraea glycinis]GGP05595.1 hypothetical protein GCM10012278_25760 [Nonomuraea glycinis]